MNIKHNYADGFDGLKTNRLVFQEIQESEPEAEPDSDDIEGQVNPEQIIAESEAAIKEGLKSIYNSDVKTESDPAMAAAKAVDAKSPEALAEVREKAGAAADKILTGFDKLNQFAADHGDYKPGDWHDWNRDFRVAFKAEIGDTAPTMIIKQLQGKLGLDTDGKLGQGTLDGIITRLEGGADDSSAIA